MNDLNQEISSAGPSNPQRTSSLIPDFDPDSDDCTVSAWINKIEQLGEIYTWSDTVMAFYLQDKLRGQARKWYNRLDDYDHTWQEWKVLLLRAFPKHRDYGSLLEEMMQRKKLPNESMTKYYQDKATLCFRCKLSDAASVSCIIRGLPASLQPNALAFQCERPDELYEGFLSAMDDYRGQSVTRPQCKENQPFTVPKVYENDPCPRCKKVGHMLRNCSMPDLRLCYKCGKQGHIATKCDTSILNSAGGGVRDIKLIQNYNDTYKKTAQVDGIYIKSYLDTGSQVNVMSAKISTALSLKVIPTKIILKGFAGGLITSRGKVQINLKIDNVEMSSEAYLTDAEMGDVDLLIGQPVINAGNVTLTVENGAATLRLIENCDFLSKINDINKLGKYIVVTAAKETLPPGTSIIRVRVEGNREDNNVCSAMRHYEFGDISYSLPATLLRGNLGYIKIINSGQKDITWDASQILTRAEDCSEPAIDSQVSLPYFTNCVQSVLHLKPEDTIGGVQIADMNIGKITDSEYLQLIELLVRFKDCFARGTDDLGCTNLISMPINLTTEKPIYRHPYRLSHCEQDIVKSKITELLNAGIIKESESSYASPVVLVKKKNGDRHYEYTRVPFGLANSPAVFMRLISRIVSSINNSLEDSCEVLAFLDDILLPSTSVKGGLKMLEILLSKFKLENLKLNMNKCSFLQQKVTYLGHEISEHGVQPAEHKLNAVSQFSAPKNVHEVRQFIGLCSYFRKFIYKFAQIARPLTDLTKKDVAWNWGTTQAESFVELKKRLCSKPVLALYDPSLEIEIHTDACKAGIAGILLQKQLDITLRPVTYFSRITSKHESMYHSYELETLAVVESLRKFRIYIVGKRVKVVTDCTAVRSTLTKRDLIPRIARWWLMIQDYDLDIEYRPGERMRHVDALSRNALNTVNVYRLGSEDWFYTVQIQDEKVKSIIDQLKSGAADKDIVRDFVVINDRLYRQTINGNRLVVPRVARWKIVQMHHDDIGHVGIKRCTDLIKNDYWFPKMSRFIKKYVTACLHCAYGKGENGRREGLLHPIPKPAEAFRVIHVDHLGPFCKTKKGYSYMLVMTDAFSKFVVAEPTRTLNSIETIRVLKKVFSLFGYPDRIVSDHGKAFTSRYFKKFVTEKQVKHTLTTIACPRANGQVERTNRTILNALRATDPSEAANNWSNSICDVIWGINNTLNDSTGFKPFDLMFSRNARSVCDVSIPGRVFESTQDKRRKAKQRLDKASSKMKRNFDKCRKKSRVYSKNDLVLWKQAPTSSAAKVNTKLDDIYSGPYIVTKVLGNDRYKIRSIKGVRGYKSFMGLVSADALRPYRSIAPVSESDSSGDEQVETEDLIDLLES
ncbi:unnamed protein product [Leptosia nina]|uniref:RNA-directed DNA polymerase n=1 Tax=Leptosia nina TaxID=320188 RepID=A0AAV1JYY7_9NEOP